jgi:hypothetical protein
MEGRERMWGRSLCALTCYETRKGQFSVGRFLGFKEEVGSGVWIGPNSEQGPLGQPRWAPCPNLVLFSS